jgi:hypothetical protein
MAIENCETGPIPKPLFPEDYSAGEPPQGNFFSKLPLFLDQHAGILLQKRYPQRALN